MSRAVGIDVSLRRGLDVVVLDGAAGRDGDRWVVDARARVEVGEVAGLLERWGPEVVCIDSPPGPASEPGQRSRPGEQQLRRLGIKVFSTPSDPDRYAHRFYDWVRVGAATFQAAHAAGFAPQRDRDEVRGAALEVFPHASDVFLRGCLPPSSVRRTMATRRQWRADTLAGAGVSTEQLCRNARGEVTLDSIDAALAALTGLSALGGEFSAFGAPGEWIVVPGSCAARFTR